MCKSPSFITALKRLLADLQKRCFQCLKTGHSRRDCQAARCDKSNCGKPHNRLLHSDESKGKKKETNQSENSQKNSTENKKVDEVILITTCKESKVLLKILPVKLFGPKGSILVNAVLEEGLTASILYAKVAVKIGLDGKEKTITIKGVFGTTNTLNNVLVNVEIQRPSNKCYQVKEVQKISGFTVCSSSLSENQLKKFPHLITLPIKVHDDSPKFLIGQNN